MLWMPISEWEGVFEVSCIGQVRKLKGRKDTLRVREGIFDARGYQVIGLHYESKKIRVYVHRLVADAFVPNPFNLSQVNHIDHDKSNNYHLNLEWVTGKGNLDAARRFGVVPKLESVFQIDSTTGCVLKKFESHTQAALEVGCDQGNISMAVRRGWLHHGYRWVSENALVGSN